MEVEGVDVVRRRVFVEETVRLPELHQRTSDQLNKTYPLD